MHTCLRSRPSITNKGKECGRRTRDEGRSARDEGLRSEVGRLRSEARDRRSEVRGQQLQIDSAIDLKVYQKAYALAMEIFQLSRSWPSEEKYSLTDQIRRASRSVCTNLREAGGEKAI
jgi:hypothetical protein